MDQWNRNVAVHRRLRVSEHLLSDNIETHCRKELGSDWKRKRPDGAAITSGPVELNFFRRGGAYLFLFVCINGWKLGEARNVFQNLSVGFVPS